MVPLLYGITGMDSPHIVIADHKMDFGALGRFKYIFEACSETGISSKEWNEYDYRLVLRQRTGLHLVHTDLHLAYRQGRLPLEDATSKQHANSFSG